MIANAFLPADQTCLPARPANDVGPRPIGLDDRLPDDAPWAATMPPRRGIGQRFPAKQPDLLVPSAEQHTR